MSGPNDDVYTLILEAIEGSSLQLPRNRFSAVANQLMNGSIWTGGVRHQKRRGRRAVTGSAVGSATEGVRAHELGAAQDRRGQRGGTGSSTNWTGLPASTCMIERQTIAPRIPK